MEAIYNNTAYSSSSNTKIPIARYTKFIQNLNSKVTKMKIIHRSGVKYSFADHQRCGQLYGNCARLCKNRLKIDDLKFIVKHVKLVESHIKVF